MPGNKQISRLLHELFEISVVLKGVYGFAEIVLGSIILFFNRHFVVNFLLYFVQGELNEDPTDWIANQILHFSNYITPSSELFIGVYFLTYGVIKLILVYGLLKEKMWSFPTAIVFMTLFGLYEIYRVFHTHSLILTILIVIDAATIFLVWHEYGVRRKTEQAA